MSGLAGFLTTWLVLALPTLGVLRMMRRRLARVEELERRQRELRFKHQLQARTLPNPFHPVAPWVGPGPPPPPPPETETHMMSLRRGMAEPVAEAVSCYKTVLVEATEMAGRRVLAAQVRSLNGAPWPSRQVTAGCTMWARGAPPVQVTRRALGVSVTSSVSAAATSRFRPDPEHPAPVPWCSCGFYLCLTPEQVTQCGYHPQTVPFQYLHLFGVPSRTTALARCDAYGVIVEHELGLRAEHVILRELVVCDGSDTDYVHAQMKQVAKIQQARGRTYPRQPPLGMSRETQQTLAAALNRRYRVPVRFDPFKR